MPHFIPAQPTDTLVPHDQLPPPLLPPPRPGDEVKVVQVPAFAESVSEGDVRFEKAAGDAVKEDEVREHVWKVWTDRDGAAEESGLLIAFC